MHYSLKDISCKKSVEKDASRFTPCCSMFNTGENEHFNDY